MNTSVQDQIVIRILLTIAKLICSDAWRKEVESLSTHIHVESWRKAA